MKDNVEIESYEEKLKKVVQKYIDFEYGEGCSITIFKQKTPTPYEYTAVVQLHGKIHCIELEGAIDV